MTVQEQFGRRVSNVVFMGMGDPCLTLPSVLKAHELLNKASIAPLESPCLSSAAGLRQVGTLPLQGMGIGARHITISTVGIPNTILRLAQHRLQSRLAGKLLAADVVFGPKALTIGSGDVLLDRHSSFSVSASLGAVSIHAPNQALRERLIPSAKVYSIDALMEDCYEYFKVTGRRVSFEYTLLAGINDKPEHATELAALLRKYSMLDLGGAARARRSSRPSYGQVRRADEADRQDEGDDEDRRFGGWHVNLIPWNPVDESDFIRPSSDRVEAFAEALRREGVNVTIRITRGLEAAAACGQLRNAFQKTGLPKVEELTASPGPRAPQATPM